ncbi:hypothetical protein HHK36_018756 [Tetracentron sinense]|uniref:Uncharacterized protein n=1 Tax=Tetracentron sinense TaxID=13715 RepID=A0A834YV37_TETSI|nr:hypothetical protein HHK36_018756 [Tetracentron sinense]
MREKRSRAEVGGKLEIARKRVKMRDLESVFRAEGAVLNSKICGAGIETHHSESSMCKDATDQSRLGEKGKPSQSTEEPVTMISDAVQAIRTGRNTLPHLGDAAYLSYGHGGSAPRPMDPNTKACSPDNSDHGAMPTLVDDISRPSLISKHEKGRQLNVVALRDTGLDLNAESVSISVPHDSFFPCKINGPVKSRDASECGSSTEPLKENDSLRMWKEMKQNGFLSSSHGGIPKPKQRERKRKNDVLKKKMELAKREQVNRFTKIAAPSGLLNELNPGIINHVRNSKQVRSILEALVKSEMFENGHIQSKQASQSLRGTKEISDGKDLETIHDSGISQLNLSNKDETLSTLSSSKQTKGYSMCLKRPIPLNLQHKAGASYSDIAERRVSSETSGASHFTLNCEDATLTLKSSSSITMVSDNTISKSNEESVNQASISSLSVKVKEYPCTTTRKKGTLELIRMLPLFTAATVASQWLELLHQDIRGRLTALQRSKKRVQSVIQTELSSLVSKEFSPSQENDTYVTQSQSSTAGSPNNATPDMHRARWTALFDQMDKALSDEGSHLESWLNEIKEMQLHCEQGLQCVNWNAAHGLEQLGISGNDFRSKKADNSERELAIRAAAASIYSTCNFVMSTENVSCF